MMLLNFNDMAVVNSESSGKDVFLMKMKKGGRSSGSNRKNPCKKGIKLLNRERREAAIADADWTRAMVASG